MVEALTIDCTEGISWHRGRSETIEGSRTSHKYVK